MFGKSWEPLAQPPHLHGQHPVGQNQTTHPALRGKWEKLLETKLLATKGLENKLHFWSIVQVTFSTSQLIIKPMSCDQLFCCYKQVILLLIYLSVAQ